jgi:hypothetical protein
MIKQTISTMQTAQRFELFQAVIEPRGVFGRLYEYSIRPSRMPGKCTITGAHAPRFDC